MDHSLFFSCFWPESTGQKQGDVPTEVKKLLIGEYRHSIDLKGRAIFPAKFRETLGESFIVTKGLDGCLAAYALDEWALIEEKIHALPSGKARNLKRFLFASAAEVRADKQGRILIPGILREYAALEKEIVVIGTSSGAEIWDLTRWQTLCGALTPEMVENAMDELGF